MQEIETPDGVVKRYARPEDASARSRRRPRAAPQTHAVELPAWLQTPAPPEAPADSLLRPSDPAEDDSHPRPTGRIDRSCAPARLQRGTLVHRLLQSLPDVAGERRRDAALKYLARNADGWTDGDREALAESVLALIADSRFAPVFARRQPRRGLDRRPAGAAGAAAGAGFRARSTGWW